MAKTLCKKNNKKRQKNPDYICKCGRKSNDKKYLCKSKKL